MVDELEEKPGERLDLQRCIGVIRRRYLLFLTSFFLGWLLFWSGSWILPMRYTWGIQIRVATAYAPPDVRDDLQGRLERVINQQILTEDISKRVPSGSGESQGADALNDLVMGTIAQQLSIKENTLKKSLLRT